jgi:flagellar hook-associated protein 3 FlgL
MTFNRVSTLAQHQSVLNNVSKVQSELSTLQRQISSGKKANTFSELDVRVEVVNAVESKIRKAEQYQDSNNLIVSRLETTNGAVNGLIDVVTEIRRVMQTARSATTPQYPIFIQTLKNNMSVAAGLLNTNVGGQYIFSGSQTNVQPVTVPVPEPYESGTPDAGYYNGDSVALDAQLSDSLSIEYGVRADDDTFQSLFAAIHLAIEGMELEDDTKIAAAIDLIAGSNDGLLGLQAKVNTNITIVNASNDQHAATVPYLQEFLSKDTDTDIVSATTKAAIDETVLQATFQVFARVSGLKLVDYLR